MDENLKFAIDNGIIDWSYIEEQIIMKKNTQILKEHPYSIWCGTDGLWHTYLPKAGGGRTHLRRKERSDLNKEIIKFWSNDYRYSFKNRFQIWVERQRACGRSGNTIIKYGTDYKRFFENDPFEEKDVRNITDTDIGEFILRLLNRKNIPYRALKSMFGYMNGTFEKCIMDKVIKKDENPCDLIDLPIYKKHCVEARPKTAEERTVSDEEKRMMLGKFYSDQSVAKFAVELAIYTGMRVGELSGLRWEDINFEKRIINIRHSERFDRETGTYYIASTKTGKERVFPLTDEIKDVLQRTKKFELKNGFLGDFVFTDEKGRVHAKTISDCAKIATKTKEFKSAKSVHALRRTLNSNMRCSGVPATVAAGLLGHSEKVNEENYTYDVTDMKTKYEIISQAGKLAN